MTPESPQIVVLGLGNILQGDDGVGVHVIRRLAERYEFPDHVEVIDGCTLGLSVLPHIGVDRRVLIVDAANLREPPGTIRRFEGQACAAAFSSPLSAHDIGLQDLLGAARLIGAYPRELMLWCVQPSSTDLGVELSPAVAAQVEPLVDQIAIRLRDWGAKLRPQACGVSGRRT